MQYDIFISYKRKSLATANNLYYRLTTRGYSVFFDLEEMRRDNFDVQLLKYIDEAKDVFVVLEEGSLDACKTETWKKDDWFCREVAYALAKGKNIIPVLLDGYKMPSIESLPAELQDLTKKNSPEFSFAFFDSYLDKLVEKEYITAVPHSDQKMTSIFKFYSNEDCQIVKDGKLVCSLVGNATEPFYFPVMRKGEYRFDCKNIITGQVQQRKECIDFNEEKVVEIKWEQKSNFKKKLLKNNGCVITISVVFLLCIAVLLPLKFFFPSFFFPSPDDEISSVNLEESDILEIVVGDDTLKMIKVEAGTFMMGVNTDSNASPQHEVVISNDYYIGETEVTQALWVEVMHYNPSCYQDQNKPVENVNWKDCQEFVDELNKKTGRKFRLPTEAEWEFAARGGNKSHGYRYSGSNTAGDVAWYYGCPDSLTHTVGLKQPNELGLYDMSGNVWEWCEDWYGPYGTSKQIDPVGPSIGTKRILRGGSCTRSSNRCCVTYRGSGAPNYGNRNHGLRLVLPKQ